MTIDMTVDPRFPVIAGKLYQFNRNYMVVSREWDKAELKEKFKWIKLGEDKTIHSIELQPGTIVMVTNISIAHDPLEYPQDNNGGIKIDILYQKKEMLFNWLYRWQNNHTFPLERFEIG